MALRTIKWSLVSLMALLSNSCSNNLVQAGFQTVNQGVVRIELEKKYINHIENLMLSDTVNMENMLYVDTN